MPLLKKKPLEKAKIPDDIDDDEEVFYCKVTDEIFRDYEEYSERIILINSMVWSCKMTGKGNLTYNEALQSERAALRSIRDFPKELIIPVLFLASKTKRTSFTEMTEDVFIYVKDRYFIGELVDANYSGHRWCESHVRQVIAPTEDQIKHTKNGKIADRQFYPPASSIRYEIEQGDANDEDSSQSMVVEASQIKRRKGPFSREKNRIFLRQYVDHNEDGIWVVTERAVKEFKLDEITFDTIFDGPLPDFPPSKKHSPFNGKKPRQETLAKYLQKMNHFENQPNNANDKNLLDQMRKKSEEYKAKSLEEKQRKAEEKLLEKQKRREENVRLSNYFREWYKPKEDLELEDQKKLPEGHPVETKIPTKYFGDALMVLEFANSFSSFLSLKHYFPGGLTFELVERALTAKEVAGPLTDIVTMFLSAIFNIQDEEDSAIDEKDNCMDENIPTSMSLSDASHLATVASSWSVNHQGVPLKHLPLYPLTVTEVLRLHLLSSGARMNDASARWQYQQRGGYTNEDDPGLAFRLHQPHILKALAVQNINQLPVGDKLKILSCLIDQLLTYADIRETIEERLEKHRQVKLDLRNLLGAERKREQEFVSSKLKVKREMKAEQAAMETELEKLQREADKKKADFESKNKALIEESTVNQNFMGWDRAYRRYIRVESLPGVFIESDERHPGVCLDKPVAQNRDLIDAPAADMLLYVRKLFEECTGSSDKENEKDETDVDTKVAKKLNGVCNSLKSESDVDSVRELLMCTADSTICPVHTSSNKPRWSFLAEPDELDSLISSLNKRGIRESELKQLLEGEKQPIKEMISETLISQLNPNLEIKNDVVPKALPKRLLTRYNDANIGFPATTDVSDVAHNLLTEHILDMEEKLHTGHLGKLKVKDREAWRAHLTNRNYEQLDRTLVKREELNHLDKIKNEKNSRPATPSSESSYRDPGRFLGTTILESDDSDVESNETISNDQQVAIRTLATALAQVAQGIEIKFLKKPLGHGDGKNNKEECDVLERWEQSLLASTSYSQIFLHFCTLETCVKWSQSSKYSRCRICHKMRNAQEMLLCDECNKGYHMYCLKPKLTEVPVGPWFCDKCRPVRKSARGRKKKVLDDEEPVKMEEKESVVGNGEIDDEMDEPLSKLQKVVNGKPPEEIKTDDSINGLETEGSTLIEVCEECGCGGHVICCDGCPNVYHLECAKPPLRRVPRGEWLCHKCKPKNHIKSPIDSDSFVEDDDSDGNSSTTVVLQNGTGFVKERQCAAEARHKIHGFILSLRRKSCDSNSDNEDNVEEEETPAQRRSHRRHQDEIDDDDDLPLHNATLQEMLADVMKHKDAWPFTRPVLKTEVPDYYDVITRPMDFGTIKYKLNMGEYRCDADLMADVVLVFDNCNTYNHSDAPVYKCGISLLKHLLSKSQELGLKIPKELYEMAEEDDEMMENREEGEEEEEEADNEGPTEPKRQRTQ